MPAIQPWSAAGAEKPMVTVSPASSLSLAAWLPPPPPPDSSGVLLVQPATSTPALSSATVAYGRRRNGRCLVADMCSPRVSPPVREPGWDTTGREVRWVVPPARGLARRADWVGLERLAGRGRAGA